MIKEIIIKYIEVDSNAVVICKDGSRHITSKEELERLSGSDTKKLIEHASEFTNEIAWADFITRAKGKLYARKRQNQLGAWDKWCTIKIVSLRLRPLNRKHERQRGSRPTPATWKQSTSKMAVQAESRRRYYKRDAWSKWAAQKVKNVNRRTEAQLNK